MTEWINVPVPAVHVTAVYALIADLEARAAAQEATLVWGRPKLARLAAGGEASLKIVTEMLDVLSARPGVAVSRSALAEEIGDALGTIQGAVSGLQRWINREFGDGYPKPFVIAQGPAEDPSLQTESYYSVSLSQAAIWTALRTGPG